ncbi:MAG: hypothetical protein ACKO4Q_03765 [Planctomycetota bacterium]
MQEPFDSGDSPSESGLESAEYRERLRNKLNCLIAVLEGATAKVKQSLAGPAPDLDRLTRIQRNLQETLEVCVRARAALDRRGPLPEGIARDLASAVSPSALGLPLPEPSRAAAKPAGEFSDEERERFARLGRIERSMIGGIDFDELARRLQS